MFVESSEGIDQVSVRLKYEIAEFKFGFHYQNVISYKLIESFPQVKRFGFPPMYDGRFFIWNLKV